MPSVSKAEQIATAIAEHHPSRLHKGNRGLLRMSHEQLHDFAATPRRGLPERKRRGRGSSIADTLERD